MSAELFSGIRDQPVPLRMLRRMLERNRVPHGLMLWGPAGVGKEMTARAMAKAVMTRGQSGTDAERTQRRIDNGNHPDLRVVAPVKKSRIIDVNAVEAMTELAVLRPFESAWRVFIVLEADRLGIPAQNHFLKTLEEPPGQALFLLVTEFPRQLLPTIRSRCQALRFGALRPATVAELLQQQRGLGPGDAETVALLSQGQMARALDLADTPRRRVVLEMTGALENGEDPLLLSEAFTQHLSQRKEEIAATVKTETEPLDPKETTKEEREAAKLEQAAVAEALMRRDMMEYLYLFETWYRDALVYRATGESARVLNRDHMARLAALPDRDYDAKLRAIDKARQYLERFLSEDRVMRDLFFALAA